MCNPRSLRVRLTRAVAQAWEEQIARTARLSTQVTGEARASVPIMEAVGERTRVAFERLIASDPMWASDSGGYRILLDAGHAYYYPETGELEIVILLADVVEVVEQRFDTVHVNVVQHLEAGGVGWWDPDLGGTEDRARQQATERAQSDLERQELDAVQRLDAEARAKGRIRTGVEGQRLSAEAEAAARSRMQEEREARQAALVQEAQTRLEAVRDQSMADVHRLIGESLREMVRDFASAGHASGYVEQVDEQGVITIQFEVER